MAGGAKLLFGLAFRSGYNRVFQAAVSQEAPQTAAGNPRFEREVKFARYFVLGGRKTADILGDGKTVGSIGNDRNFSAGCDAERCTDLS